MYFIIQAIDRLNLKIYFCTSFEEKGKKTMRIRKIITLLFLLLGALSVDGKHSKFRHRNISRHITPSVNISNYLWSNQIIGIDVSKHTGLIDWDQIKQQGIGFAYIKSTEGVDYLDPRFSYNVKEAKDAGVPVGAYHFFRFHRSGAEQAINFMTQVNINSLDLPPVVDVEEWGQYSFSKNVDNVAIELQSFIKSIEALSTRKVVIYADQTSYKKYIEGRFKNNRIWICSLGKEPQIDQKWSLWQQCHRGRCAGTKGIVDINLFNGNEQDWKAFTQN